MIRAARPAAFAALALAAPAAPAAAGEYDDALRALAHDRLAAVVADPAVVEALRARNAEGAPSPERIAELDARWRAQLGAAEAPLVAAVLSGPAAARLVEARDASQGLITEAFVMDAVGLNVAASDATSDYWQGDEAKWRETYGVGPDALHIGEVELDESTQTYQAQVSMPVLDPEGGAVIGAATFGVNVEFLE